LPTICCYISLHVDGRIYEWFRGPMLGNIPVMKGLKAYGK